MHQVLYHRDPDGFASAAVVSLYSTHEDVHCGRICKELGGGGHKGAAGFQMDLDAFWELVTPPK